MRYNFSADFVKVTAPDTSFADAWETICYTLLLNEFGEQDIIKLKAPEKGIDIWRPVNQSAYQCKSNEHGYKGSIDMSKVIQSLSSALLVRNTYKWREYIICVNASITGSGYEKLLEFKKSRDLSESDIKILQADDWSELAEKHIDSIKQYLDYRLLVTEDELKHAFEKARYYDQYIQQYMSAVNSTPVSVKLTNNRTPICIELPFSSDLTVKQLLDVAKALFGIDMNKRQYKELETSASPSVSLLYNGQAQSFDKKISEVIHEGDNSFELWIKIVWRDYREDSSDKMLEFKYVIGSEKYTNRGQETIRRTESFYQANMWDSAISIKKGIF